MRHQGAHGSCVRAQRMCVVAPAATTTNAPPTPQASAAAECPASTPTADPPTPHPQPAAPHAALSSARPRSQRHVADSADERDTPPAHPTHHATRATAQTAPTLISHPHTRLTRQHDCTPAARRCRDDQHKECRFIRTLASDARPALTESGVYLSPSIKEKAARKRSGALAGLLDPAERVLAVFPSTSVGTA